MSTDMTETIAHPDDDMEPTLTEVAAESVVGADVEAVAVTFDSTEPMPAAETARGRTGCRGRVARRRAQRGDRLRP